MLLWVRSFAAKRGLLRILLQGGLCVLLLVSCTHMRSGQYIQLRKGEGLDKLSKWYAISPPELLAANKGRKPATGKWYFIPLKRGFLGQGGLLASPGVTESYLNSGNFIWPVPSSKRISSRYGKRWGKHHQGIDIAGRSGSSIVATADGKVVYAGNALRSYGNLVVLSHGRGFFSVYAHNKKNYVKKGERVYKGQVIGLLGQTGRATGVHLHFEIRRNSRSLDPVKYVYKNW